MVWTADEENKSYILVSYDGEVLNKNGALAYKPAILTKEEAIEAIKNLVDEDEGTLDIDAFTLYEVKKVPVEVTPGETIVTLG